MGAQKRVTRRSGSEFVWVTSVQTCARKFQFGIFRFIMRESVEFIQHFFVVVVAKRNGAVVPASWQIASYLSGGLLSLLGAEH